VGPRLTGAAIVAVIGYAFFTWRLRWRTLYGIAELAFALGVGGTVFAPAQWSVGQLCALGGAVYVAVRGLDNIRTGIKEWPQYRDRLLRPHRRGLRSTPSFPAVSGPARRGGMSARRSVPCAEHPRSFPARTRRTGGPSPGCWPVARAGPRFRGGS
jgi:hypothetical protein